jgi:protein associated with RNAse G/E
MKAKVRGIYSTALTKLLLENGFEVVQPSLTIKNRFKLLENSAQPDIKIKDRYDLQGLRVLGSSEAVKALQHILQSSLPDVLTRRWGVSVDGIYKGKVVESEGQTLYVDIGGNVVGKLPKNESINKNRNNNQLLVQVERKRIGARQPILTTNLKIVGRQAILVQHGKGGVSLKIRDFDKRAELYALGKILAPDGWGIIWREAAAIQPKKILESEIEKLTGKVNELNEKALYTEAPTLLIEGSYFMDVELPWFSKRRMDELRASAAPTLSGHHFYKCCSGRVSAALEMAEQLIEKGQSIAEVENLFKKQISCDFPDVGSVVEVEHVKPNGLVFNLGQATIERLDEERIEYSRTIRSEGTYDGLEAKKEIGDKAVSETKMGEWYIITKYLSNDGKWKGTYVNLNTPIEVYPQAIRYVDLEVDICIQPDGETRILDMDRLEKALEKGYVSQKLFEMVKQKVNEIAEMLKENKPL